jgi:hypothetical protein
MITVKEMPDDKFNIINYYDGKNLYFLQEMLDSYEYALNSLKNLEN